MCSQNTSYTWFDLYCIDPLCLWQSVPPTTWYRFVAGLNAQLRLVRRGFLRTTFRPVLRWLDSYANPALRAYGMRVDLGWFQATRGGYYQYGLLVYAAQEEAEYIPFESAEHVKPNQQHSR